MAFRGRPTWVPGDHGRVPQGDELYSQEVSVLLICLAHAHATATASTHYMLLTGCRLVTLLALALGLPGGFFEERFSKPVANVRAVHYLAGQPSKPEAGIFGVGKAAPPVQVLPQLGMSLAFEMLLALALWTNQATVGM